MNAVRSGHDRKVTYQLTFQAAYTHLAIPAAIPAGGHAAHDSPLTFTMKPPSALPPALHHLLGGKSWHRITMGESPASVHRLAEAGQPDLIIKIQPRDRFCQLAPEAERLRWLHTRAPVPEIVDFIQDDTHDFLLMRALPGEDAAITALEPLRLVEVLADSLRLLHSVPTADCPFHHTIDRALQEAQARVDAGRVDETDFNPENRGRSAADVFQEMLSIRPSEARSPAVLTHGDFCLPNVMIAAGRLSGFIDLGSSGLGDPYRDLALAARSLERNTGPDLITPFFARYGLPHPDPERLRFYSLLDELF